MKKFFITVVLSLSCVLSVSAQKQTEASTLNLIVSRLNRLPIRIIESIHWFIKVLTGRRIDNSVVLPVWLCCLKRTTRNIQITTRWGYVYSSHSTMPISYKGYDLYIKKCKR